MAEDGTAKIQGPQGHVEQYRYGANLDVAKIIFENPVPDVCGVVPTHMTYKANDTYWPITSWGGCSKG